jgi:hypothetical protein
MDASNLKVSDWLWKKYRMLAFYHSLRDPGYRPLPQMSELPHTTTHPNQPDQPTLDFGLRDFGLRDY